MSVNSRRDNESGIVILGIMILMVFVLIGMVFLYVKHAQDKKSVSTTAAEAVSAGGTAIARSAENVQRKNDASIVLTTTAQYAASNGGQLPLSFQKGMLQGLGHYAGASVVAGEQDAVTTDDLRLVIGAVCANGGRTAASSAKNYAVQFALANADDSFTPQCQTS